MKRFAASALGLFLSGAGLGFAPRAAAQEQPPGPARLVAFTSEPAEPELGKVFDLRLTVRLAPDVVAFFPDTLLPEDAAVSAGPGRWELTPAPADSVDVRATYPLMGLDLGGTELPSLELWIRPAAPGERGGPRRVVELASTEIPRLERRLIPVGGVLVMPLREMTEAAEAGLVPRPPGDVLGGDWSPWLVGALAIVVSALGALGWILFARMSDRRALAAPRLSPRAEALEELDRVLELGWHANGRVAEFYDATTGALRRFAARTEAHWRTSLTSTELLSHLAGRWGPDRVERLGEAIRTAERVKFGTDRPDPTAAEADWAVVRRWIEELPER